MPTSPAVTRRRGPAARSRKAVLTGAAGNLVANFDGSVLTYFIPTLAAVFYPTKTPSVGLMLVLASYGAGFLMKPLGAVLFGIMGDRWGRRPALYGSIAVMGLSSLVITVLPGYATIGAAAPMLLVLARLIEGLAMGAEYGLSAAYLVEFASQGRRAFVSSSQQVTMIAGTLLASAVATALTTTLPSAELREWAWRVPFAVGTALCAAVATLRYRVDETLLFAQLQYSNGREARALWHAVRTHPLALLRAGALSVTGIVAYHVWLEFLPTYAHAVSNVDSHSAQLANTVALGMMLLCIPLCAMLSDRFGRRPTMLVAAIGIGVLVYPMLLGLNTGSPGFLIAQFGGAVLLSFDYANGPAIKAELFPTAVRAAGIGIPYSLAGAVFGSSASLVTGYFAGAGQPLLFGGCITLACLINVIALVLMPETHNRALD